MTSLSPKDQSVSPKLAHVSSQSLLNVAACAQTLNSSATLAINEAVVQRRAAGCEIIHLGFGEASLPLYPPLKQALTESLTHTGYAPVLGIPALCIAIAEYLMKTRRISTSSRHIIVGPGSKPLLYALLHLLEGDLLLPVPAWVSYAPQARLAGKRVIPVPTDPADQHRLTPDTLAKVFATAQREGLNPRILLVNSPSNPTGSMFDRADVEALAFWAREAGIILISDEIYAELAHGWREHISPACFYPEGCIVTGGLSKAFSAGGWRLGYAAVPVSGEGTRLITALAAFASEIWSATTTPIQEAAITAFTWNEDIATYIQSVARLHGYVADSLYRTLTQLSIVCPRPAGGFYLYPDFTPWRSELLGRGIRTSQDLASHLLNAWNIATLPGSDFGEAPEVLRLRLSTSSLYDSEASSPEEHERFLWQLLDHATALHIGEHPRPTAMPYLPALERAREQLIALSRQLLTGSKK